MSTGSYVEILDSQIMVSCLKIMEHLESDPIYKKWDGGIDLDFIAYIFFCPTSFLFLMDPEMSKLLPLLLSITFIMSFP